MDGGATAQGLFAVVICVVMATHRVCIGNYAGMSIEYVHHHFRHEQDPLHQRPKFSAPQPLMFINFEYRATRTFSEYSPNDSCHPLKKFHLIMKGISR